MYTRSAGPGRGRGRHRQRRSDVEDTQQGNHSQNHNHNPFRHLPPRNRSAPPPNTSNRKPWHHARCRSQPPRDQNARSHPPTSHFRTGIHSQRPAWLLDKRLRELLTSSAVVNRDLDTLIRQIELLQPDPEEMPWEPTFNREIIVLRPKAASPFTDPNAYQASTEREAPQPDAPADGPVLQQPPSTTYSAPGIQQPPPTSFVAPAAPAFPHSHMATTSMSAPPVMAASTFQNPSPLRAFPQVPVGLGQLPTLNRDPVGPGRVPVAFGAPSRPFCDLGTHHQWHGPSM